MKNLSKAIALVGAMTASSVAMADGHESAVDVSMSAGVATSYLFRGAQLGGGSPMVYGDLVASAGGAYGGIWIAGGDTGLGQEYDLFVGYGGEVGDISYDINLTNYVYTEADENAEDFDPESETETFEYTEAILSLGYKDFGVTYIDEVTSGEYSYAAVSYGYDKFGFTYGTTLDQDADVAHVDVSYAYSDSISFIASKQVDNEAGDNSDVIFVVDYSLPL